MSGHKRGSKYASPLLAVLRAAALVAPLVAVACSNSSGGGGSGTASDSGGADGQGADAAASSSSGGSSSSGSSSGSSASSSSGSGSSDAGNDATSTDGGDATLSGSSSGGDGAIVCGTYTPPTCGSGTCDLRTNDCCGEITVGSTAPSCDAGTPYLDSGTCFMCSTGTPIGNTGFCQGAATCNPSADDGGTLCQSTSVNEGHDNVSVGCASACDCSEGQVCCADHIGFGASTSCQTIASGASCPDADAGAGAQFCQESSECTNGQPCLAQTCLGVLVHACGVQSQDPFDCTDGGPPEGDAGAGDD